MTTPLPALRVGCVTPPATGRWDAALCRRVVGAELRRRLPEAEVCWLEPDDALGGLDQVVLLVAPGTGERPERGLTVAALAALAHRHVPAAVLAARRAFLAEVGAGEPPPGLSDLDAAADRLAAAIGSEPTLEDVVAWVAAAPGDGAGPVPEALAAPDVDTAATDAELDRVARDAVRAAARREGLEPDVLQARRAAHFAERLTAAEDALAGAGADAERTRQALADRLHEAVADGEALRVRIESLEADLAAAQEARAAAEAEAEALRRTLTFRATTRVRDAYGRLRRPR
jgi:hypothetical protein